MAKFEKVVIGDFNTIVYELDKAIREGGVSMNLVEESTYQSGDVLVDTRVYDKYFMRNSSRCSLSVTVVSSGDEVYISAIGAGGGQGVFFNFSLGAEAEMVDIVRDALERMGL